MAGPASPASLAWHDRVQYEWCMASSFGWLDVNSEHRKTMLEVIDQFRDEGTTDDLGIGSIRDALSELLFPGTSVLHTRLRYVLFIPWLMQDAARTGKSAAEMGAAFRKLEFDLIESLLRGGEQVGVIGSVARSELKQLPSASYWSALRKWQIHEAESASSYFRRMEDLRTLAAHRPAIEADSFERMAGVEGGLDASMPAAPDDLLDAADFALRTDDGPDDEEAYLSRKIELASPGTALAWLVRNPPGELADYVWDVDHLDAAPEPIRQTIDHARRFSITIQGASLLYNLILAQKAQRPELVDAYEGRLEQWRAELETTRVLDGWDQTSWWDTVRGANPNLRRPTITFVDSWLDLVRRDDRVARNRDAMVLIAERETGIKGGRARLRNQAALDRWGGASGTGRHAFRWQVAQRHLNDLYAARERRASA